MQAFWVLAKLCSMGYFLKDMILCHLNLSCQRFSGKWLAGIKPAESVMLRELGNSQAATQRCSSKSSESHTHTLSQQLKIQKSNDSRIPLQCNILLNCIYNTLSSFLTPIRRLLLHFLEDYFTEKYISSLKQF